MSLRVLIAVTHLLGVGHLTRAAALGRAFAARGHRVTLVSGGRPAPLVSTEGMDLVQLTPLRSDGMNFKTLVTATGERADEAVHAARRDLLLRTLDAVRPDVVITELFPFGRRGLAAEFMSLVEAARALNPRPLVAASIRDILAAPSKPERVAEAHERLARNYDLVLVHGDPALVPLDASWPVDEEIRPLLKVTGYVDEGAPAAAAGDRRGIVVSGGSSEASLPLYRAALGAAALFPGEPWRMLVGAGVPEEAFGALAAEAPPHLSVERARPDFRALLAGATVSVSQAGYNTLTDLLRTGPAMVLVPFEGGSETEQRLRAACLARAGLAVVVTEAELSPERLAGAVREALARPRAAAPAYALDGAARSVAIVEEAVRARPALRLSAHDWSPAREALRRAAEAGTAIPFWWRDDDAVAETPALRRLLALAQTYRAPVALAAIPARLDPSLAATLSHAGLAEALVHGWAHANHAPEGERKAEFGAHRTLTAMELEARSALREARRVLGDGLVPVFVPPWNRMAPGLAPGLARAGYRGLSTFRDRAQREAAPGLVQINTHLDPIDWRGRRGLADPQRLVATLAEAIARRAGEARPEPIGLLTHHLVHDDAVWSFCESLLEWTAGNGIRFSLASHLFLEDNRIVMQT